MGYYKEQVTEQATQEQASSPWEFMRRQAERYERSLQRMDWMRDDGESRGSSAADDRADDERRVS